MIKNLSIILPARNEAFNIKRIIPAIFKKYNRYLLEIIVVDDCSTDDTGIITRQLRKKYKKIKLISRYSQPGVGRALREGIKNLSCQSQYVLFMDSDFFLNVSDIAKLIRCSNSFDGVVGSRFINKNSLNNYPKLKLVANRSYQLLAKIILGIHHSDLTNNFKLFHRKLVDKISPYLTSGDYAVNAELGFYPVILGYKIGQVPVCWHERTLLMGFSKFKIFKVGPSYINIFIKCLFLKLSHTIALG